MLRCPHGTFLEPYPGTQHGFHDDSAARYAAAAAADLAGSRTLDLFAVTLA